MIDVINEYYPYEDYSDAEAAFRVMLDETNEPIQILDLEIDFSVALERLDTIAFDEACNNWIDSQMRDRVMSIFKVKYPYSTEYWYAEDEDEARDISGAGDDAIVTEVEE